LAIPKFLTRTVCFLGEADHLNTVQLPTATHSDRGIEAFHCSNAMSGQLNRVHLKVTLCFVRVYIVKLELYCKITQKHELIFL